MKNFTLSLSALALAFVLASGISSCKKEKTCHGTVRVVNATGTPVSDATVKLAVTGADVAYESTTDGSGNATFEVELPAIFDVSATKSTPSPVSGTGILRLDEAGKSDDVTVTVN